MSKKDFCPKECSEKHNKHEIVMAEMLKEMGFIKEKMIEQQKLYEDFMRENKEQHEDIKDTIMKALDTKANKSDVESHAKLIDSLFARFWALAIGLIGILLSVLGFLIAKILF